MRRTWTRWPTTISRAAASARGAPAETGRQGVTMLAWNRGVEERGPAKSPLGLGPQCEVGGSVQVRAEAEARSMGDIAQDHRFRRGAGEKGGQPPDDRLFSEQRRHRDLDLAAARGQSGEADQEQVEDRGRDDVAGFVDRRPMLRPRVMRTRDVPDGRAQVVPGEVFEQTNCDGRHVAAGTIGLISGGVAIDFVDD